MSEFLTCPDVEELAAWIDGEVDQPTRLRLATHVADCDRCAAAIEEVLAYSEELELSEDRADNSAEESGGVRPSEHNIHPLEPDFSLASSNRGFEAGARRIPWGPYAAAALAVCVALVSFRLIQQRPSDLATLSQDLQSLDADRPTARGPTSLLTEKELPVARKCRRFLKRTDRPLDPKVLTGCLDLVARDPDLASQVVVETPDFIAWLESPDQVGISSCEVLESAWEHLRGARQDELRSHHEICGERINAASA